MFSFSTILALLEAAPTVIDDTDKIVADIKALLASADVQSLEASIAKLFTVTTTPGQAAVIEPFTGQPATGRAKG
jgi:uncharacterized membrane protein YgcG